MTTTRPIELTEAQHGVLAAQLIDPSSAAFTVGEAVVLEAGPGADLDDERLRAAIAGACAEATGMWLDLSADPAGTAAALRAPSAQDVEVAVVDLIDLSHRDDPDAAAAEHLAAAMAQPFDLGGFPLHEQTVLRLGLREIPAGWTSVHGPVARAEALAWVDEHWSDLRPLSARGTP